MALIAYNLTTTTVILGGTTARLPASSTTGERGDGVNVTSEVESLTNAQLARANRQVNIGHVVLEWSNLPEFATGPLTTGSSIESHADLHSRGRESLINETTQRVLHNLVCVINALNGKMVFTLASVNGLEVKADLLNAAPAGTAFSRILVTFEDGQGRVHCWADREIVVETAEAVADVDVAAPTINPDPVVLNNGSASFDLIFDTDAGVTKTYVNGDSVSVTVKATATSTLYAEAVSDVPLTIDVL